MKRSWEDFLDPAVLRPNLILASIYIAAFELLKNAIVKRIQDFYTLGGTLVDREYQSEVLSKNKSPVYASLEWLKQSKAIDEDDLATFEQVKERRNEIAHAMTQMLTEGLPSDLPARFDAMVSLLDKIERWWIVNVEDIGDTDRESIIPGTIISLKLLVEVALGSEDHSRKFLDEFIKQTRLGQSKAKTKPM